MDPFRDLELAIDDEINAVSGLAFFVELLLSKDAFLDNVASQMFD